MTPRSYSICIPTYRRQAFLRDLLDTVAGQQWPAGDERIQVVVVDNDPEGSAREVLLDAQKAFPFTLVYVHEPRRNIARARNAAVRAAVGDAILFVDDDQLLPLDYLAGLDALWARVDDSVGAILGSVRAEYPSDAPAWLVAGAFFDRPVLDGSRIPGARMRTGGVTVRRRVFDGMDEPFDPRWGLMGGEDNAFFDRAAARGEIFQGSSVLELTERVTRERATVVYVVRDSFRKGMCHALLHVETHGRRQALWYAARGLASAAVATGLLAASSLLGRTSSLRALALWARQIGKLFAIAGGEWSAYSRQDEPQVVKQGPLR